MHREPVDLYLFVRNMQFESTGMNPVKRLRHPLYSNREREEGTSAPPLFIDKGSWPARIGKVNKRKSAQGCPRMYFFG
jgi:hypothetical protein